MMIDPNCVGTIIKNFEKSGPQVAPLLVRLYESRQSYDRSPAAQTELTNAVLGLLDIDQTLESREQEMLADVLIELVKQAEKDLREALSQRLSVCEKTPLRLALFLANDEITVAEPMLRQSVVFSDLDLVYIIKSKGPDYWQAIAARESLSDQIINTLSETRDVATAIILSENDRVVLTRHALSILSDMAKENDALARPLLMRQEMPESLARQIYRHVGEDLRSYITTYYGISDPDTSRALREITIEFADAGQDSFLPTAEMTATADKMAQIGKLTLQLTLETLGRGQIPSFIALFSEYTGIQAQKIYEFLKQPCPKGLAIVCRAYGIQKSEFSRIFMMTHRVRSRERFMNNQALTEALAYFDKIKPEAAFKIVQRAAK